MRLDVTIFEKSYDAFPENIEINPEVKAVFPLQIPPGGKDASVGGTESAQAQIVEHQLLHDPHLSAGMSMRWVLTAF